MQHDWLGNMPGARNERSDWFLSRVRLVRPARAFSFKRTVHSLKRVSLIKRQLAKVVRPWLLIKWEYDSQLNMVVAVTREARERK